MLLNRQPRLRQPGTVLWGTPVDPENESEPAAFAWVREVGHQRIVYTNMGHPDGFEDAAVHRFLLNAARWCLRASDISAALSLAERVPA